jgi:hypothetical protein
MVSEASSDPPVPRVLDVIDYFARTSEVREGEVKKLLPVPRFQAAVLAFVNETIPLGYAVLFCRNEVAAVIPDISAQKLADIIQQVARRIQLDQSDSRYIHVDVNHLFQLFPELYFNVNDPTDRQRFSERIEQEMQGFDDACPWKNHFRFFLDFYAHKEYISYWVDHSEDKVGQLFLDANFRKHFDALLTFKLEYGEFLKEIYGGNGGHILFPELGWHLSAFVLGEIGQRVKRGSLSLTETKPEE